MNNKALNAIGSKIQDVASSVANSNWAKNMMPTVEELNETIAKNTKLSQSLYTENIQKNLATMFQGIDIPEEEALRMAKNVNAKNYEEAINNLSDDISKYTDKPVDKVIERAKAETALEISKGISTDTLSTTDKVLKYPQAYFMNPDKKVRNTRIATTAATYAGVAVGGRYLSGGTLTRDNYGRKDIAGVPFI